jgi:hypothetical protein
MLRKLGDTLIEEHHRATCHCGAVEPRLHLPNGIENPRRCDCSLCRRRGTVAGSVALDGITIVKGEESLGLYPFNTHTAKHFFCKNCGIYTHHQRRSNPNQYGFNIGCLDGVNPFDIDDIPVNDDVNHPADRQS